MPSDGVGQQIDRRVTVVADEGVEVDPLRKPVRDPVRDAGDDLARGRRWFASFGSCSIEEPLADLRELGLVG